MWVSMEKKDDDVDVEFLDEMFAKLRGPEEGVHQLRREEALKLYKIFCTSRTQVCLGEWKECVDKVLPASTEDTLAYCELLSGAESVEDLFEVYVDFAPMLFAVPFRLLDYYQGKTDVGRLQVIAVGCLYVVLDWMPEYDFEEESVAFAEELLRCVLEAALPLTLHEGRKTSQDIRNEAFRVVGLAYLRAKQFETRIVPDMSVLQQVAKSIDKFSEWAKRDFFKFVSAYDELAALFFESIVKPVEDEIRTTLKENELSFKQIDSKTNVPIAPKVIVKATWKGETGLYELDPYHYFMAYENMMFLHLSFVRGRHDEKLLLEMARRAICIPVCVVMRSLSIPIIIGLDSSSPFEYIFSRAKENNDSIIVAESCVVVMNCNPELPVLKEFFEYLFGEQLLKPGQLEDIERIVRFDVLQKIR